LRESMFLNGILTNSEIWYGLKKSEIEQLENLDKDLMRKIMNTPISTPSESMYLELGCIDIETVIKSRRINYLHYLTKRNEAEMLHKFFSTQWKYPTNKQDWTEQVKMDLEEFKIPVDLDFIKAKSTNSFKTLVKIKAREHSFFKLMQKKMDHSKMDNIFYGELKMQTYLKSNQFTTTQAKLIYSFRIRMANFQENFQGNKGHTPCPLCYFHLDSQSMAFQCVKLKEVIKINGKLEDVFEENIPMELVNTLTEIIKYREQFRQERALEN
jgi:hypothetical protein